MCSSETFSDPLFWPALFETVRMLAVVTASTWIVSLMHRKRGIPTRDSTRRSIFGRFTAYELKTLILSLFGTDEVCPFLELHLGDEGRAVVQGLSPTGAQAAQVYEILVALQRHGLIDDAFFDALVAERPRREADIRRVQRGGTAADRRAA